MKTSRFLGWILVGVVSAMSETAWAQSEAERQAAGALMDDGDARFAAGDFGGAQRLYQQADDIMHVPSTGVFVAEALARQGKLIEARDKALAVVQLPKQGDKEPRPFVEARERAQTLANELTARIPSIIVRVQAGARDVALQGVELTMDGHPLEVGVPSEVDPGPHRFRVKAPGYVDAEEDREIGERQVTTSGVPTPESTGEPTRGAAATPNGQEPPGAQAADASGASVSAAASPVEIVITLEPVAIPVERAPLAPPVTPVNEEEPTIWSRIPALGYVGFGVGALGVGVGTVTGILSWSKTSSIREDHCGGGSTCTRASEDDRDSATMLANVSNVAFGVGVVGIGIGVYAVLASPGEATAGTPKSPELSIEFQRQRVVLRPLVGPDGVMMSGEF